ncbi:MAG TPA: hypothetical protein VM802_25480 [Chitinophaga sp.]|uniref:hypothetical protein n=1 Tax=Chitinophaga sp. TaxID=1869181 RepID=UPI002B7510E9|nr:hypothetical protein [Chitinophaga sp.]HVI48245.1 hypothetical protein [Chitinophaga sp.]
MNKKEKEYIKELKEDKATGAMIEDNKTGGYKIRVIERGERLFYQQGNRGLLCEIQIRNGAIFSESIKEWDNNEKVTQEEKNLILDRLKSYFINFQGQTPIVH